MNDLPPELLASITAATETLDAELRRLRAKYDINLAWNVSVSRVIASFASDDDDQPIPVSSRPC